MGENKDIKLLNQINFNLFQRIKININVLILLFGLSILIKFDYIYLQNCNYSFILKFIYFIVFLVNFNL
jgi:hypothetical protein